VVLILHYDLRDAEGKQKSGELGYRQTLDLLEVVALGIGHSMEPIAVCRRSPSIERWRRGVLLLAEK
ncbi:hypothetical protein WG66_001078, partial [Moniliophthora roreri]